MRVIHFHKMFIIFKWKIKYINNEFDFNGLSLAHPNGLQGGSYFTKLTVNNESLYLQTKRCRTKQGIVKTIKNLLRFDV